MKNKLFAVAALAMLFACNQAENTQTSTKDSLTQDSTKVVNVVELKDAKKAEIFTEYVALKDALVKSSATEAQSAANKLQPLLLAYEGCEKAADMANKIAESGDLKTQRSQFTDLSTDLIALLKNAELTSGTIYVQHCPMANKGDGGDWLSAQKEIKNPYYGDEMLECGSVVEEINKK